MPNLPFQKMQPIFNSAGNDAGGGRWTPNMSETRRPQEPISIPVRHVGRPLSTDTVDGPTASTAVTLRGEGLQSPSVLMQSIKPARRQSNREERCSSFAPFNKFFQRLDSNGANAI